MGWGRADRHRHCRQPECTRRAPGREWGASTCWHRCPPPNPLPSEWEGEQTRGELRRASLLPPPFRWGRRERSERRGQQCQHPKRPGTAVVRAVRGRRERSERRGQQCQHPKRPGTAVVRAVRGGGASGASGGGHRARSGTAPAPTARSACVWPWRLRWRWRSRLLSSQTLRRSRAEGATVPAVEPPRHARDAEIASGGSGLLFPAFCHLPSPLANLPPHGEHDLVVAARGVSRCAPTSRRRRWQHRRRFVSEEGQ